MFKEKSATPKLASLLLVNGMSVIHSFNASLYLGVPTRLRPPGSRQATTKMGQGPALLSREANGGFGSQLFSRRGNVAISRGRARSDLDGP
jgi:hypothetical protein